MIEGASMKTTRTLRRGGVAGLAAALCASVIAPVHAAQPRAHAASGDSIVLYSAQGYDSAMSKAYAAASTASWKFLRMFGTLQRA